LVLWLSQSVLVLRLIVVWTFALPLASFPGWIVGSVEGVPFLGFFLSWIVVSLVLCLSVTENPRMPLVLFYGFRKMVSLLVSALASLSSKLDAGTFTGGSEGILSK
jgi:hypothetical protein